MGASHDILYLRGWLAFSIAMVSLICSLMTLVVIRSLRIWNGNLFLITTLTLFKSVMILILS